MAEGAGGLYALVHEIHKLLGLGRGEMHGLSLSTFTRGSPSTPRRRRSICSFTSCRSRSSGRFISPSFGSGLRSGGDQSFRCNSPLIRLIAIAGLVHIGIIDVNCATDRDCRPEVAGHYRKRSSLFRPNKLGSSKEQHESDQNGPCGDRLFDPRSLMFPIVVVVFHDASMSEEATNGNIPDVPSPPSSRETRCCSNLLPISGSFLHSM
jgi:hypothetical protein